MKNAILIICCFVSLQLLSQDFIFTNFTETPTFLGPQFACGSKESVNVHYLMQGFFRGLNSTYKSSFISFNKRVLSDSSYAFAIAPKIIYDKAGESQFRNAAYGLALAYSKKMTESAKYQNEVSVGVDVLMINSDINEQDLRWPTQIGNGGFDPDLPGEEVVDIRYININTGINIKNKWQKVSLDIGYTFFNINRPSISHLSGSRTKKYVRHQLYGYGTVELNKDFSLNPKYLYTQQGPHSNYIIGSDISYKINANTEASIGGGMMANGYYFSGGTTIKKIRLALCFDVFDINKYYGGELNMSYKL